MTNRTFAYVSAPITNNASSASQKLKEYCKTLYELGYLPVCPAMLFSRFLSDAVPEQREARREMALSLLRRCRVLVVCSDDINEEMESEILLAKRLGIVATTLTGIKKISLHTEKNEEAI